MSNLNLKEPRCKGADGKFYPTICPVRNKCQRHLQLELDRQLGLPAEVAVTIKVLTLPRIGRNECHYSLGVA